MFSARLCAVEYKICQIKNDFYKYTFLKQNITHWEVHCQYIFVQVKQIWHNS